jgi:L-seryl-tRNA(Ser) seleniumtransferase
MPSSANTLYRQLPSTDELLRLQSVARLVEEYGAPAVTEATRDALERLRDEIGKGRLHETRLRTTLMSLPSVVQRKLQQGFAASLQPVINATGVVLHTNLGRAPLAKSALARIAETAGTYSNVEYDEASGERGKRDVHVQRLFAKLLNAAEAPFEVNTVVVNNCAAAVMLALNTLAEDGEVIVSRGELVEIGGSFRVPDVMAKSQAILREVGTTNRTRIADYERAITDKTRLLLRVHRSNFAIVGFTEQPPLEELVALGNKHKIPVLEDQGNGSLFDLRHVGVKGESGVVDSLHAGVDVVTYSGDKLLGGPQAGMLSGRKELIATIRANPMFRALRCDKLTYAALEATLLEYLRGDHDSIPALRMMKLPAAEIKTRAEQMEQAIRENRNLRAEVVAGESLIGGGTAPTATLPTFVLAITHKDLSADEFAAKLRGNAPTIAARVEEGRILIDLRTVFPEQDAVITTALQQLG